VGRRARVVVVLWISAGLLLALLPSGVTPAQADQVADRVAQAQEIADKLGGLNLRLMDLAGQHELASHRYDEAKKAADEAQGRLDAANEDVRRHQRELARFSVNAYVSGGGSSKFDTLLTTPAQQVPVASSYLDSVGEKRKNLIDQLAGSRDQIDAEALALTQATDEAQRITDQLDQAGRDTTAALAEQKDLQDTVNGELVGLVTTAEERAKQDAAAAGAVPGQVDDSQVTEPPVAQQPHAPDVVKFALTKLGAPYIWAAAGPETFDCSGLVLWAWAQAGVSLDHYTGSQYAQTQHIKVADLQPGDLVFFWAQGETGDPGHVGIYVGDGLMVHAPHEGGNVMLSSIYYWSSATVAASRVIPR
jgi:cell wall-associated NlpC family hydrolase